MSYNLTKSIIHNKSNPLSLKENLQVAHWQATSSEKQSGELNDRIQALEEEQPGKFVPFKRLKGVPQTIGKPWGNHRKTIGKHQKWMVFVRETPSEMDDD